MTQQRQKETADKIIDAMSRMAATGNNSITVHNGTTEIDQDGLVVVRCYHHQSTIPQCSDDATHAHTIGPMATDQLAGATEWQCRNIEALWSEAKPISSTSWKMIASVN